MRRWLLFVSVACAACVTPAAPRGRFTPEGNVSFQLGWQQAHGPVSATISDENGRANTYVKGDSPGWVEGLTARVLVAWMPALSGLRYQFDAGCDAGVEATWRHAGGDLRCALPGTDEWVALSAGGRSGLEAKPYLYEARVALDLVKPTSAKWVPIANVGGSWGRRLLLVSGESPRSGLDTSELFNMDALLTRKDLRLEQMVGMQLRGPSGFTALSLFAHQVLRGDDLVLYECGECEGPTALIGAKHSWAIGVMLSLGIW